MAVSWSGRSISSNEVDAGGAGFQGWGAALARHVIGALAGDLDRREDRRDLHDVAGELWQLGADLVVGGADVGGGGDLAVGVVGVSGFTEAEGKAVELGAVHHVGDGLGGGAERDGEDAGGERVEGAAVAGLLGVEGAANAVDHVGAGETSAACR